MSAYQLQETMLKIIDNFSFTCCCFRCQATNFLNALLNDCMSVFAGFRLDDHVMCDQCRRSLLHKVFSARWGSFKSVHDSDEVNIENSSFIAAIKATAADARCIKIAFCLRSDYLTTFNRFKPSGVKWLHFKVFRVILV